MDNTIIQQGQFVSTGADVYINLRSGVDWIRVLNMDRISIAQTVPVAVEWYWQRGMPLSGQGYSVVYYKANQANSGNLEQFNSNQLYYFDSSDTAPGASVALTAISNANPPVVTSAGSDLSVNNVVRIINVTGASQLGGYDFTVGNSTLTANTFSLDFMTPIAAATNGFFRLIPFDPIFYPRNRSITNISQAANAVITLSVVHQFFVGQAVRIYVPAAFGMTQMNGLQGTIIAVSTTLNTITVNIDSTGFTAFAFPLDGAAPFTPAQVVPIGEDTGIALASGVDILSDATINTASIGIRLVGGEAAGTNGQTIDWIAGKSFNL